MLIDLLDMTLLVLTWPKNFISNKKKKYLSGYPTIWNMAFLSLLTASQNINKLISWSLILHGTLENPVNLRTGPLTSTPPGPESTATQPGVCYHFDVSLLVNLNHLISET